MSKTIIIVLVCCVQFAAAEKFYVDPVNGAMSGDGSEGAPWSTFDSVWAAGKIESFYGDRPYSLGDPLTITRNEGAPVQGGDTLMLLSGYHGSISGPYGYYNKDYVTIMNAPGHTPKMKRFNITSCSKWRLVGLSVSPSNDDSWQIDTANGGTCISMVGHGYNGPAFDCVVEACTVFTEWDATAWSIVDWWKGAWGSISAESHSVIKNNVCKNIQTGPFCRGDSMVIEGNLIENMAADGLRAAGTDNIMRGNIIKGIINCSGNHDDAIQCYPSSERAIVEGNIIIEFDFSDNDWGASTPAERPFSGATQGIFGGPWNNARIINNLVICDHYHGISVYGDDTENNRIINNTVIDLVPGNERTPWCRNFGTGTGHVIKNNVGYAIGFTNAGVGTPENNFSIGSTPLTDIFNDPDNFDFSPKKDGPLVDAGTADGAPATDLNGIPRPQGAGVDIGAYEWTETGIGDQLRGKQDRAEMEKTAHPMGLSMLRKLIASGTAKVYDLKGSRIQAGTVTGTGMYLVQIAGAAAVPVVVK